EGVRLQDQRTAGRQRSMRLVQDSARILATKHVELAVDQERAAKPLTQLHVAQVALKVGAIKPLGLGDLTRMENRRWRKVYAHARMPQPREAAGIQPWPAA